MKHATTQPPFWPPEEYTKQTGKGSESVFTLPLQRKKINTLGGTGMNISPSSLFL